MIERKKTVKQTHFSWKQIILINKRIVKQNDKKSSHQKKRLNQDLMDHSNLFWGLLLDMALKVTPFFRSSISIAPCGKIVWIIYGPDHWERYLPENRCKWELNKSIF